MDCLGNDCYHKFNVNSSNTHIKKNITTEVAAMNSKLTFILTKLSKYWEDITMSLLNFPRVNN